MFMVQSGRPGRRSVALGARVSPALVGGLFAGLLLLGLPVAAKAQQPIIINVPAQATAPAR